jgi:lipopolysaccharide export system protein LptA
LFSSAYSLINKINFRWFRPAAYIVSCCFPLLLSAQLRITPTPLPVQESKITLHSEDNQIVDATTDPATQYLNGNVKVFHSGTFMFCDTAILRGNYLRMYHNVAMMQHDTILLFADSVHYNGDDGFAVLYGQIILDNGGKKLYTTHLEYDIRNKIAYYTRNARLEDGKSTLISRRGQYLLNEKIAYFAGNVFISGENFSLVSDSISYNTENQVTNYFSPVRIKRDTADIYSLGGWFDLDDKVGDFIGNAQYVSGSTMANADTIHYNGQQDYITLKSKEQRSTYISDKDTAYAYEIYYDRKTEVFRLTGDSYYKNDKNEVRGEIVNFNKSTESFRVSGRSYISDPPIIIEADDISYDKQSKTGIADYNVVWQDTTAKTTIYADHVKYRGEDKYMKATNDEGRPLFTTLIDNDTLFLRADTLKSFQIIKKRKPEKQVALNNKNAVDGKASKGKEMEISPEPVVLDTLMHIPSVADTLTVASIDSSGLALIPDTLMADNTVLMDTIVYFVGDNNVRMYKADMQSVCDSLIYSIKDSIFMLAGSPFVWTDSTQISGDTIQIFLRDKKVDRLTSGANALIVTSEDLIFFNQIRGKQLESFFENGKAKRMDIDGNAEALYYILDKEKAYIGVNRTECSNMKFYFNDNKISEIRFYNEPSSRVIPMQKADHEGLKVKGFIWNAAVRPFSNEDL